MGTIVWDYGKVKPHWSASQWKSMVECSARTLAEQMGLWQEEDSQAFAIGSLVDSLVLGGDQDKVFLEHPCLLTKTGESAVARTARACAAKVLGGQYRRLADLAPETIVGDLLDGCTYQKKLEGVIAGQPWIGYADAIDLERRIIIDLKTVKGFAWEWVWDGQKNSKVPFYEKWGYWTQLAVYREMARQAYGTEFSVFILAVSKADPPRLKVLAGDNTARLDRELAKIEQLMPEMMEIKAGTREPVWCGECDFCSTYQIPVLELMESVNWR